MSTNTPTAALSRAGVSIWLDDLSRKRITTGELERLIGERDVVGVTTNPTIFATAFADGASYTEAIHALAAEGADVERAIFDITTHDVRDAADHLRAVYDRTDGYDGRVSIEVQPGVAHDAERTIEQAHALWEKVDRPNVMIKIPATVEGLGAITAAIGAGISVNVTLIFSLDRYRQVIDAYLTGLEQAKAAGIDLATIHSVASFFVSRVDTEIDKRLAQIGTDEALGLKSKAGIANARLAYQLYEEVFGGERATALLQAGANRQRPLWASTGVKDPALPDTLYVTELVATGVVNTMPEKTLEATFDHGEIVGDTVTGAYADAGAVLDALARVGVDYDDVTAVLEREGVEKFIVSWNELLDTVRGALEAAR
ncbi:transaldolase [Agromyces sp. 3263]|uniref:transaldolase n=1 Tax=Agromyces sp. 3263 TaxID=2817750 RepID=UPI002855E61B|nr:transaldolase [Agromyces sp. 3263]MDR6905453.1 transaldolase [Agromyces sp. 3263]